MSPVALRSILLLVLLTALALPAQAQLPPSTPEQRAAGDRVVAVEFDTEELVVERDQTASVSVRLVDAEGNPVDDAVGLLIAEVGITQLQPIVGDAPIQFRSGVPNEGALTVLVLVTSGANAFGIPGATDIGSLPVRVLDWPAEAIEVEGPAYTAYVGTSLRLGGRVLTDRGTEHATAQISWRSADASVAVVTDAGVFTGLNPGTVIATARTENDVLAELEIDVIANPVTRLSMSPSSSQVRTGDVVQFDILPIDAGNGAVTDAAISLSASGLDGSGGLAFEDGTFVAEQPGAYRVIASVGNVSASALVEVVPRGVATDVELVDHGVRAEVTTSDLWVFEGRDGRDYAYTGTHSRGGGKMFVWDVTDPAGVLLVDSVTVDARVVNDVKVSDDASRGPLSHARGRARAVMGSSCWTSPTPRIRPSWPS